MTRARTLSVDSLWRWLRWACVPFVALGLFGPPHAPPVHATSTTLVANIFADPTPGDCATTGTGDCSLREAVLYANAHAGATIALLAGTYALTIPPCGNPTWSDYDGPTCGDLNITNRDGMTTLVGVGAGRTVIDASGMPEGQPDRVLRIDFPASATVKGVTIRGGFADPPGGNGYGGGIVNSYDLTLIDSEVTDNRADNGGAGIHSSGHLTIIGSAITHNRTTSTDIPLGGGGLFVAGTTTLTNTIVGDNSTCTTCTGYGVGTGGGIRNEQILTLDRVTVSGGSALYGGGIDNSGTLTATDSLIGGDGANGNRAVHSGGGIYSATTASYVTLRDTRVIGNRADGTAEGEGGGGIFAAGPETTLVGTTISGNAAKDGGGIYALGIPSTPETANIFAATNSTFSGNSAATGGAIRAHTQPPGGWIPHPSLINMALTNVTIADNISGIDTDAPGGVTVRNSLLANQGANCLGAIASKDYNLSSDATCTDLTHPHDVVGANPRLGPLANNGGPTKTHALLANSPALDAGGTSVNGCPATDQRGMARPSGAACDIGAFELTSGVTAPSSRPGATVPVGAPPSPASRPAIDPSTGATSAGPTPNPVPTGR